MLSAYYHSNIVYQFKEAESTHLNIAIRFTITKLNHEKFKKLLGFF